MDTEDFGLKPSIHVEQRVMRQCRLQLVHISEKQLPWWCELDTAFCMRLAKTGFGFMSSFSFQAVKSTRLGKVVSSVSHCCASAVTPSQLSCQSLLGCMIGILPLLSHPNAGWDNHVTSCPELGNFSSGESWKISFKYLWQFLMLVHLSTVRKPMRPRAT